MVKEKGAEKLKVRTAVHEGYVPLPAGGLDLDSNDVELVALFAESFVQIDNIEAQLEFDGDLWDQNEAWYIPEFGGQYNQDAAPRASAGLNSIDCAVFVRFACGRFRFRIHCENGTVHLKSLRFFVTGVAA